MVVVDEYSIVCLVEYGMVFKKCFRDKLDYHNVTWEWNNIKKNINLFPKERI